MKKYIKIILSAALILSVIFSTLTMSVSAASVTVSGGNYEVGDNVTISIAYEGDAALTSVLVSVGYDAKILKFSSVSGVKNDAINATSGSVKFLDEEFSNGSKKGSYRLNFTAIAAGTANISVTASGSDGAKEFTATNVSKVTVSPYKPSDNANLSSIKLSAGNLTPSFDPNNLFYNVTVRYDVEEITITGTKADGKSTYIGGGTFALNVGKNEQVLTVTAENGKKNSYIIYIKRMTEEETQVYDEEQRNSNPTLVVINGNDYTIDNELNGVEIPAGFTKTTAIRKESEITVLKDEAGKYELCWLIDNNGEGAFYSRDEQDKFTKLVYINAGEKTYIVEPLKIGGTLPSDYKYSKCVIDGTEVKCIAYADEALNEYNIFNCYVNGKTSYYRLDTVEGTMQRATDLEIALATKDVVVPPTQATQATEKDDTSSVSNAFKNFNKTGKIVVVLVVAVALLLIAIAIILIVKIASSKKDYDYDYGDNETNANEFVFGEEGFNEIPNDDKNDITVE